MRYGRRTLICIAILCLGYVPLSSVFATESDPYDCTNYASYTTPEAYATTVYQTLTEWGYVPQVFTKQDLATALGFLQHYCCEEFNQKDASKQSVCSNLPQGGKYYPQSPYIFDHLVSVGMRKLDAKEDDCKALHIDCILQNGNAQALEWRRKINEIMESTEWYPPSAIQEYFYKYRWTTENISDPKVIHSLYYTMCDEAQRIRTAIGINANDVDAELTYGKWLAGYCYEMAQQRYEKEVHFVRTMMVQKGIQYHQQNLSSYLKTYFIDNRLSDLLDKFIAIDGCFSMVLKYISRTSCCNY
jgi:hypothetical protein